jgi:hypothetical protein
MIAYAAYIVYNQHKKELVFMQRFVPYNKLSKKEKRARNLKKRRVWEVDPTVRRIKSKKVYNRKKPENEEEILNPAFLFAKNT